MKTLKLKFPKESSKSCEVIIGSGLMKNIKSFLPFSKTRKAFIVSDQNLKHARKALIQALGQSGWQVHEIPVSAGESLKDLENIFPIYGKLLKANAHRDSVLFALGGGSVGDAAGFVASTYLRGISWVGVPTTLLAQVDSSLGGKTAVNHPCGKNLIGAFHQPLSVICDVDFLRTLSRRELISGLGEAIKYGIIYDPAFFKWLEKNWDRALNHDASALTEIVQKSLKWKAAQVMRDEFDRKGIREFLNFGHTLGHALEEATRFRVFQHGEAVLWGMRFALALSEIRGDLHGSERGRIDSFLSSIELPKWPRGLSLERLLLPLSKDKKIRNGKLHFVLVRSLGRPFSCAEVTQKNLMDAYQLLFQTERRLRKGQGD